MNEWSIMYEVMGQAILREKKIIILTANGKQEEPVGKGLVAFSLYKCAISDHFLFLFFLFNFKN